ARPTASLFLGPDAMEPRSTEKINVGRVSIGPAVPAESWPGDSPFPDPSPDGLIVGPEFLNHPGHAPQFTGEWVEPERPVALLGRHRHALPSGPPIGQLAPGLCRLALALSDRPTADARPGLASADRSALALRQPLEEPLQRLQGRCAGPSDLGRFQDDS